MYGNKKGLTVAIETVLMIVLSISVMTILIIFLATQTNFFKRFINSQEDENNIDLIVSKCNSLVDMDSKYSYCCEKRAIDFGNKTENWNCSYFSKNESSSGRVRLLDCTSVVC